MLRWTLAGALLLATGMADGQAGLAPTSSLALEVPPGPVTIALGTGHTLSITVTLAFEGVVCPQATNATVALTVADRPAPLAGVRGVVPSPVVFDVPGGAYAAGRAFNASLGTTLQITVGPEALPDHAHEFEVTADFAGGTLAGCPSGGPLPAAQAQGLHRISTGSASNAPAPAPTSGDQPGGTPDSSGGNGASRPPPRATPQAPLAAVVLLALLAAVARR